ncbi:MULTISPECIES: hypothetical protein [Thiorhodovibrio]|uniref:hypothetical protein n=1 Tax=Thiorhodovibrio TaxID=61593 RepID=UPI001914A815|nr:MULTISPECIES: hypothetical protein [Thiorhodovibrio]MBK5968432.1 hypothetical protein [Thiorhodovibrio winogradskyi]WPL11072.1 hypothetical protein Thiosp_00799 [Thiorhodovibrio litoralis]
MLLFGTPGTWAGEGTIGKPRVRLSSFGTLGMAYSSQADLHAQRDWGQPDTFQGAWSWKLDSIFGVQANAQLADTLNAGVQLVLKDRPAVTLEESLQWGFLAWQPSEGLVLRGGRLGIDFYMLSDYRNVGFAYLWQRPPIEFYGPLLPYHVDGFDLTYQHPFADGIVLAKVYAGTTRQDVQLVSGVSAEQLELTPMWGGSLSYENERWRLKAGFGHITFGDDLSYLDSTGLLPGLREPLVQWIWPAAQGYADDATMKGKSIGFYSLGASFDDNTWLMSGELGYLDSEWGPVQDSFSAYLSIGRRWGHLTPYVLLAAIEPVGEAKSIDAPPQFALSDPALAEIYAGTKGLYSDLLSDQRTLSLGLRWDVSNNMAMKFQWDHSQVRDDGLWWNTSGDSDFTDTRVNVLSASLNWMF